MCRVNTCSMKRGFLCGVTKEWDWQGSTSVEKLMYPGGGISLARSDPRVKDLCGTGGINEVSGLDYHSFKKTRFYDGPQFIGSDIWPIENEISQQVYLTNRKTKGMVMTNFRVVQTPAEYIEGGQDYETGGYKHKYPKSFVHYSCRESDGFTMEDYKKKYALYCGDAPKDEP